MQHYNMGSDRKLSNHQLAFAAAHVIKYFPGAAKVVANAPSRHTMHKPGCGNYGNTPRPTAQRPHPHNICDTQSPGTPPGAVPFESPTVGDSGNQTPVQTERQARPGNKTAFQAPKTLLNIKNNSCPLIPIEIIDLELRISSAEAWMMSSCQALPCDA
jgi:hypothetical protein